MQGDLRRQFQPADGGNSNGWMILHSGCTYICFSGDGQQDLRYAVGCSGRMWYPESTGVGASRGKLGSIRPVFQIVQHGTTAIQCPVCYRRVGDHPRSHLHHVMSHCKCGRMQALQSKFKLANTRSIAHGACACHLRGSLPRRGGADLQGPARRRKVGTLSTFPLHTRCPSPATAAAWEGFMPPRSLPPLWSPASPLAWPAGSHRPLTCLPAPSTCAPLLSSPCPPPPRALCLPGGAMPPNGPPSPRSPLSSPLLLVVVAAARWAAEQLAGLDEGAAAAAAAVQNKLQFPDDEGERHPLFLLASSHFGFKVAAAWQSHG